MGLRVAFFDFKFINDLKKAFTKIFKKEAMPYIELVNFRQRLFQLAPLVLYDFDTVHGGGLFGSNSFVFVFCFYK